MPTIKTITTLFITLLLTHGHYDHVARISVFNNVYMSSLDKEVYNDNIKLFKDIKLIPFNQIQDLNNFDNFELGNHQVITLSLARHTPGSMIFIDLTYQIVFTGDALGSGCGCWLQVPGSLTVKAYKQSLEQCLNELEKLKVNDNWLFCGDHNEQWSKSLVSANNQLNLQLMKDMIILCQKLLGNTIIAVKSNCQSFKSQAYYASYQKAELIYTLQQIKKQYLNCFQFFLV